MYEYIKLLKNAFSANLERQQSLFNLVVEKERFLGYPVCQDDVGIQMLSGLTPDFPMAMCVIDKKVIYVNKGFYTLTKASQKAILAHEVGHIEMGVRGNKASMYNLLWKIDVEIRADLYALEEGYDIREALVELSNHLPRVFRNKMKQRINFLKEVY